jgi:hypothetical protein
MAPSNPLTSQHDEHRSERRYSNHQSMVEVSSGLPDLPFVRPIFRFC